MPNKGKWSDSTTSNDIDMKFEPVTKFDKGNIATSKRFGDDGMSPNCDVIVIFQIYGQFEAIRKPDSRRMVCKTYISLTVTFYLTKTENRNIKSLIQLSY